MIIYLVIIGFILVMVVYSAVMMIRVKSGNFKQTQKLVKPIDVNREHDKKFDGFMQKYPVRAGEGAKLTFGAVYLTGGSNIGEYDVRVLQINERPDKVIKYVLAPNWGIDDTASAHEQLTALSELGATKKFNGVHVFPEKFVQVAEKSDLEIATQGELSKQTMTEYGNEVQALDGNLMSAYFSVRELGISASKTAQTTNLAAWDIERLAGVSRQCYAVGFITEDDCYMYLTKAMELAKSHYNDWEGYTCGYFLGRARVYSANGLDQWLGEAAGLLQLPNSIWNENANIWSK